MTESQGSRASLASSTEANGCQEWEAYEYR